MDEGREKAFDVIALGELLVDFAENGKTEQGNTLFEACPGGAPCNVLALLSKMGKKTAFMGKVGRDQFGVMLRGAVTEAGIDASCLLADPAVHTTLAFVHTFPDGDRDFSFYRNPGADMMLTAQETDAAFAADTQIFHFGTLSMTHEGVRAATKKAVEAAKAAGALISFDPNYREPLWPSAEAAKEQMLYGLSQCDILKISDNEIQLISGEEDFDAGIAWLKDRYDIALILLTMGKDGSRAYYHGMRAEHPGFHVDTIETTGAGDTFGGSALNYVLEHDFAHLTEEQLAELLTFANAAAAIVTTRKGAIRAMPSHGEVENLIAAQQAR